MLDNHGREIIPFDNEDHQIQKYKEWGLMTKKAKNLKENIVYKLRDIKGEPCDVLGFVQRGEKKVDTTIIQLRDDEIVSIHPAYLVDMQKKGFEK